MGKAIKTLLIIVGVLIVLFVAAAAILVATVDPNDYKEQIAQAVKDNTGRELTFEGDIGFNFFPWLGLRVGSMALGNAKGFAPDEMLRITKAQASIQIMPLLTGEVKVGMVVLDGLTANLAKNRKGVTNWDDLAKPAEPEETNRASRLVDKKDAEGGKQLEALSVEGVEITNANILYDDQQAGKKTTINNLNLIVGEIGSGERFPFELSLDLKLDDPKIDTRPTLTGFGTLDQDAGTFDIDELKLAALNLELTGKLFARFKEAVSYSGELALAEMSVKQLMREIGMEPLQTADPEALEAVSADIKLNGTDTSVALEKMTVMLDATTIEAEGSVTNFDKPAIRLTLNVDDIDADRYMPPKAEGESGQTEEQPAEPAAQEPAQEPDLSALKELDLGAKLTVGRLKVMNLIITEILAELTAGNGVLAAKPVSLKLYDGVYEAEGKLDANPRLATWSEKGQLKGVQAGPLLKDLTGKAHLEGAGVVNYDLHGFGLTPDNIKRSITGTASFSFMDGAVNGVNVAKMIRDGWNKLKGKPAGPDEPQKTDFAELLGSATLREGHIVNKDLLMKSPLLRLTGEGWANLPGNNTDYLATATVVGTLKGQDGESMDELKGLPLPVRIKGDLNQPDISLDLAAMAKALFGDSIKKGTKAIEDSLRKTILGGESKTTDTKSGTTTDTKKDTKSTNPIKKLFQ
ncbi:AsmA family protein [Pseudodesulfovibrio portus]|uniref:Cell envelope biogenesis protein AsmA n=1 Tax=Pseudodesulfovibrio portus TaxID=231439 RepID=A0ABM8AT61_9BACT|nr:AsmA family protein [Pseudodesulfovibrio portus]BDQ34666.1 cell envelope biogenesis protein AsmA [Pseudodesulfovibrio portus]